jgi:hypothetical protein
MLSGSSRSFFAARVEVVLFFDAMQSHGTAGAQVREKPNDAASSRA